MRGEVYMPKKKCPFCSSKDIIKILYGMPTYETFEAAERGKIFLGGCCISANKPKWHCKACGHEFI